MALPTQTTTHSIDGTAVVRQATLHLYQQRLQRVLDWLVRYPQRQANLQHLAGLACFSPYHFHRIYSAMMGETVQQTQRRFRLHRAAVLLMTTALPVQAVARKCGYGSVQALGRPFRTAYGLPPAQYRHHVQQRHQLAQHMASPPHSDLSTTRGDSTMNHTVSTVELDAKRMLALSHCGDYNAIGEKFEKLMLWAAVQGLLRSAAPMYGLYYDDPQAKPAHELQSDACLEVDAEYELPAEHPGLHLLTTRAGRAARLLFKGPYAELLPVYQWFYQHWLPSSGEEPADAPPMEEYLNSPHDTLPSELLTAIYIPLKT